MFAPLVTYRFISSTDNNLWRHWTTRKVVALEIQCIGLMQPSVFGRLREPRVRVGPIRSDVAGQTRDQRAVPIHAVRRLYFFHCKDISLWIGFVNRFDLWVWFWHQKPMKFASNLSSNWKTLFYVDSTHVFMSRVESWVNSSPNEWPKHSRSSNTTEFLWVLSR